jgi:hypothetical protein
MADTILFQGNRFIGDTVTLAEFFGAQTGTNFEVLYSSGVLKSSYVGVNFTYDSSGFFDSGTITSQFFFGTNGQLIEQYGSVKAQSCVN